MIREAPLVARYEATQGADHIVLRCDGVSAVYRNRAGTELWPSPSGWGSLRSRVTTSPTGCS